MSNGESKGVRRLGTNTYRLILFTILIIVWQIISMSLGRMFLPTPSGVATAAVELFANGTIIEATLISLATFATGYLLAVALAIPMGLMMGGFKKVGEALDVVVEVGEAGHPDEGIQYYYEAHRAYSTHYDMVWAGFSG